MPFRPCPAVTKATACGRNAGTTRGTTRRAAPKAEKAMAPTTMMRRPPRRVRIHMVTGTDAKGTRQPMPSQMLITFCGEKTEKVGGGKRAGVSHQPSPVLHRSSKVVKSGYNRADKGHLHDGILTPTIFVKA